MSSEIYSVPISIKSLPMEYITLFNLCRTTFITVTEVINICLYS